MSNATTYPSPFMPILGFAPSDRHGQPFDYWGRRGDRQYRTRCQLGAQYIGPAAPSHAAEWFDGLDEWMDEWRGDYRSWYTACPYCGNESVGDYEWYVVTADDRNRCRRCNRDSTEVAATIFERSNVLPAKWWTAIWLLANYPGMGVRELRRYLAVDFLTALRMRGKVLMALSRAPLGQCVEWYDMIFCLPADYGNEDQ